MINNINTFHAKKDREYLGLCDIKGYLYSVQVSPGVYEVVAVKGNQVTSLIQHTIGGNN